MKILLLLAGIALLLCLAVVSLFLWAVNEGQRREDALLDEDTPWLP